MGNFEAAQIYKIYVNDSLLTIASDEAGQTGLQEYSDSLMLRYHGKTKFLLNIVDNLEKSPTPRQIILQTTDVKKLFTEVLTLFRWIEAGGGVVRNKNNEILAIFRRKRWDLPKGKLDPGETFEEAAVREVIEETGIKSVERGALVTTTMHSFRTKRDIRSLKVTKWYEMTTEDMKLVWQVEEDIENAIWIDPVKFLDGEYDMFASIREVVQQYLRTN
ncbi:MAG: NUDIX hydrolase [Bacteroidetes bacterium]|nr:MAG: NUDIX hydrolase [Bacteroidota bacterium]